MKPAKPSSALGFIAWCSLLALVSFAISAPLFFAAFSSIYVFGGVPFFVLLEINPRDFNITGYIIFASLILGLTVSVYTIRIQRHVRRAALADGQQAADGQRWRLSLIDTLTRQSVKFSTRSSSVSLNFWFHAVLLCSVVIAGIIALLYFTFVEHWVTGSDPIFVFGIVSICSKIILLRLGFGRSLISSSPYRSPLEAVRFVAHSPVLYLRAFEFDGVAGVDRRLIYGFRATEEQLVIALCQAWNRYVLAIGRPGEPVSPHGAHRIYVANHDWQCVVKALAAECGAVIWASGRTEGLKWEAQNVLRQLDPLCVLIWLHIHLLPIDKQNTEWALFKAEMDGVFPKPFPVELPAEPFLCFDENWTPMLVPNVGARIPFMSRTLLGLKLAIPISNFLARMERLKVSKTALSAGLRVPH